MNYIIKYHSEWHFMSSPFAIPVGKWVMVTSTPEVLSIAVFDTKPTARQIRKEVKRVKKYGRDFIEHNVKPEDSE